MTLPSVSSDWLMFPASRARLSTAPERPMFSLPARSTCRRRWAGSVSLPDHNRCRGKGLGEGVEPRLYQVKFSNFHQLLPVQGDLLHVDGDGEDRVGATIRTHTHTHRLLKEATHLETGAAGLSFNLE